MKKYFIIVAITSLPLAWYCLDQEDTAQEQNSWQVNVINNSSVSAVNTSLSTTTSASSINITVSSSLSSIGSQVKSQTKYYDGWNSELPEDYKNWKRSRGYFSDIDLQEYQSFKLEKLEELANQGDLKAIEVLIQYERSSLNWTRFKELLELSVVAGSLKSLSYLTTEKKGNFNLSHKEEDMLEMFVYLHLQAKRGDLTVKYDDIRINSKIYNFYPNEEQQKYIDRRTDEMMASLEKRRKKLGLLPFDNKPMESERRKYELINEYRKNNN